MTDNNPKRRAWFQLHLSTCVVLMIVAGALVWVNVVARYGQFPIDRPYSGAEIYLVYGWPVVAAATFEYVRLGGVNYPANFIPPNYELEWRAYGFWVCGGTALGLLAGTAIVFECWMRRRDRGRQSEPASG